MKLFFLSILIVLVSLALVESSYAQKNRYVPGEVLIKLKGEPGSILSHAFIGKMHSQKAMSLKQSFAKQNLFQFALKTGQSVEEAMSELQQDPQVEYVEPNYIIGKMDVPAEGEQVRLSKEEVNSNAAMGVLGQSKANLGTAEAWLTMEAIKSDYTPVVAIIDTGVDYNHTVFASSEAIWTNAKEIPNNNIDDDMNGYVDDVNGWNFYKNNNRPLDDDGHGTHVAGIVLGATQDIFSATIPKAQIKIMPLKFLGPSGEGTTSDAIKAIYYAIENGARVLNNSWGGEDYSASLHEAIAYAYRQNVVFVAAAGNSSSNNDNVPIFPAGYDVPQVMAIAAVNDWDTLARFSNYGAKSVHLGSPGVSIFSTYPKDTWGYSSGTSMAAPFVSGIAALLLREQPNLNSYEIKGLVFGNSRTVTGLSGKVSTGGVVNAAMAVQGALEVNPSGWQPDYTVHAMGVSSSAAEEDKGAGCGLVTTVRHLPGAGLFALLVLVPIVVWRVMRKPVADPKSQRKYERYKINTDVAVNVGGRELIGSISTISLGGVQLNTDALLEKGGVISLKITSPDGGEQIEVQGQVVWSEAQKHYGIQFAGAEKSVLSSISKWTMALVKSG